MSNKTTKQVLSNYGFHAFVGTNQELYDITRFAGMAWNVDTKEYRVLSGDGFALKTLLGQNVDAIKGEFVRTDDGIYTEGSTYKYLLDWAQIPSSGANKWRKLYVCTPRGQADNTYEAAEYNVALGTFTPGDKNTDNGQEFSGDFIVSGKPVFGTGKIENNVLTFTPNETA